MLLKIIAKIIFGLFIWKKRRKSPKTTGIPILKSNRGEMVEVKPEKPKEGGILSHFPHQKFPFPGFPDKGIVYKVAFAKKLIPLGINWMHKQMVPFIPKNTNLYSRSVREIYRVFNIVIERETRPGMKEKFAKIRDVVCVIAEYDDAYRFIFQDGAGEIRLEELILSDADKWWFLPKPYTFKGKEEFKKKHEDKKDE